jgi:hypothetical protein
MHQLQAGRKKVIRVRKCELGTNLARSSAVTSNSGLCMLRMKLNGTCWEYLDTITYLCVAAASTHRNVAAGRYHELRYFIPS